MGVKSFSGGGSDRVSIDMIVRAISEGFDQVSKDLNKTGSEMDKLAEKEQRTAQATDKLAGSFQKVGAVMVAAAAAGGLLIASATKLAARVETLGVVTARMGQNVGKTAEEVRELEQAIMDKGITLQAARQSIALMIQAELDLARATDLARLAQDAAVITGQDSSSTFRDLIYAISTGNRIMLRRMQLSADFEGAYKREADAIGKSTLELTEKEKVVIRLNAVVARGANISGVYEAAMETAGKKITSLTRYLEESRRMLGEIWLPIYAELIDFVTNSLKAWVNLDASTQKVIGSFLGFVVVLTAVEGMAFLLTGTVMKLIKSIQAMTTAMSGVGIIGALSAGQVTLIIAGIAALVAVMIAAGYAIKQYNDKLDDQRDEYQETRKEIAETTVKVDEYRVAMEKVHKERQVGTPENIWKEEQEQVQELIDLYGTLIGIKFDAETGTVTITPPYEGARPGQGVYPLAPRQPVTLEFDEVGFEHVNRVLKAYQDELAYIDRMVAQGTWVPSKEESDRWYEYIRGAMIAKKGTVDIISADEDYRKSLIERRRVQDLLAKSERDFADLTYENIEMADAYLVKIREQTEAKIEMEGVEAGLRAGLQGTLEDAMDQYVDTMGDLTEEHEELSAEKERLLQWYSAESDQIKNINSALADNEAAQRSAGEAIAGVTSQMLYQQVVAKLSTQGALDLARSMGLIDEASYSAASMQAEWVAQMEAGQITEEQVIANTKLMNEALADLTTSGEDFDRTDIEAKMKEISQSEAGHELGLAADAVIKMADDAPGLTEQMGLWITEAELTYEQLLLVAGLISDISGTHTMRIDVQYGAGTLPPDGYTAPSGHESASGSGQSSLQHGGQFNVPMGYPRDRYGLRVSSGEHVAVTPAHIVSGAGSASGMRGGGGGMTLEGDTSIVYHLYSEGATALALAEGRRTTYGRLNSSM